MGRTTVRTLTVLFVILIAHSLLYSESNDTRVTKQKVPANNHSIPILHYTLRDVPEWSFSNPPMNLLTSYYDYMIGSYNSLPLCVIPESYNGGYNLTFQGKRTPTGYTRAFYYNISNQWQIQIGNEITSVLHNEGFPAMTEDLITGKPFMAWQTNADNNIDAALEVQAAWDAYMDNVPGFISDPDIIINNPITIIPTSDNEFITPIVQTGPSPVTGMRRVYILGKNSTTHTSGPCENPYIAYADFNADMLENVTTLTWSYISVPQMNQWNNDTTVWRQPFYSFCAGNDGRIYIVGYHSNDLLNLPVNAPDLDVFICDNYGLGTWQYYNYSSHIPVYNPHINNGTGPGYFTDTNGIPYADDQIFLKITNSSHLNAVVDENDIVHMIGLWGLGVQDGNLTSEINTIKEMTFDANTHAFAVKEIYPYAGNAIDNLYWLPWDTDGNGVTDNYESNGNPVVIEDWNYPYWDETVHNNTMISQYNNLKITKSNAQGWMAAVWQNSERARKYHLDQDNQYLEYSNAPEIYISVSNSNGHRWSDPIILNSVDTALLAGECPMWVYPADTVKYVDTDTGRLGLMYFDDNDWGSYDVVPSVGPNSGGTVKMMELEIDFGWIYSSGIAGYVFNTANNQPIHGALVSVGGIQVTTDEDGYFRIYLIPGVYQGTVQFPDFYQLELSNIIVSEDVYTDITINLVPIPTVVISGTVMGGNPPVPLPNAIVTIEDDVDHIAMTNNQGFFSIGNIHVNQTYDYVINRAGFHSVTDEITVTDTNIDLGTILLIEYPYAPNSPHATISGDNTSVFVSWTAPTPPGQRNLTGYRVWRLLNQQSGSPELWTLLTPDVVTVNQITDNDWELLPSVVYKYAIKAVYSSSELSEAVFTNEVHRVVASQDDNETPFVTGLSSIYPNPSFIGANSHIQYDVAKSTGVIIEIYNLHGQLIRTLVDACKPKGRYNLEWDGKDKHDKELSSGIYLCKMTAGNVTSSMKLVILK